jgi:sugar-specific transcriptional regulator TrmB
VSQEKLLKTLVDLGLKKLDAKVYIILSKTGPQRAKEIARLLRVSKQQLYPSLKNLRSKSLVNSTLERPARFAAVKFDKALDLFAKAKMEEAKNIQQKKGSLLSDWQSIVIKEAEDKSAKFTVIEGRKYIYSKIQQMIQETKNQLSIITTVPSLVRADQFGTIDTVFNHPLKSKIKFRFLTEISKQNVKAIKNLLRKTRTQAVCFEGRTPDLGLRLNNRILIKDDDETLFLIETEENLLGARGESTGLWTNSKTLVKAFATLFEDLWSKSSEIEKKVVEIETGKPTPKTYVLGDPEIARERFFEALSSAKKEIVTITSLESFRGFFTETRLRKCVENDVSIRIMAPITVENLRTAQELSNYCEVKHLPASYLRTTLVDRSYLFQFKTPNSEPEKMENPKYFENTFYTNDPEYIEKTETMLNELWRNARILSSVTLKSIIIPPKLGAFGGEKPYDSFRKTAGYIKEPVTGAITEKDILEKMGKVQIVSAEDPLKDITIMYGYGAQALINPPEHFDLPRMIIMVFHCNEQSTFGVENWLIVQAEVRTPKVKAFVPVTIVGDNPLATDWRKKIHEGTPLEKNLQLVKEDELQVKGHGNILFAGWTTPIPLHPIPKVLPASSILFEGYGKIQTGAIKTMASATRMQISELNYFEAFVNYFHTLSKYSGPGTDGLVFRDMIITSAPKTEENRKATKLL